MRRPEISLMKLIAAVLCCTVQASAISASPAADSPVKFAFITDTHLSEGAASVDDLSKCLRDVNSYESLDFVIFGGDVTNFGSDAEIALAKSMMDTLRLPYYVVQGNHDANWSESGCNTFRNVFGYEYFTFNAGGWRFIGCNSGPDMRMAPGLVPRETVKWLQSLDCDGKSIFINHYPMDSSVLNYFDVTRELKRLDVRFEIGGHWHSNRILNYQGIPAALCRSSLSAGGAPGYTVVRLGENKISFSERRVYGDTAVELEPWYTCGLAPVKDTVQYDADGLPADYPWMRYDVNKRYGNVSEVWKKTFDANIAAGFAVTSGKAFFPLASGNVKAVSLKDGSEIWTAEFPGKIYSTPAVSGNLLVFGCSDGYVYALKTSDGSVKWKYKTGKSVLASPLIMDGKVYIGGSDGKFRALDLKNGSAVWTFSDVKGHVVSTPYGDRNRIVFGTWGKSLYSLDPLTGRLQWIWRVDKPSCMYSPASTVPLYSAGRVFVAVPDRRVYAIDADTGKELFHVDGGRDAIGLGGDGRTVFSKVMSGKTYAFPASVAAPANGGQLSDSCKLWEVRNNAGYDIAPSALTERDGVLYIPTDKGNVIALRSSDGEFLWAHKISVALVNPIEILIKGKKSFILASTMDGTVSLMALEQ